MEIPHVFFGSTLTLLKHVLNWIPGLWLHLFLSTCTKFSDEKQLAEIKSGAQMGIKRVVHEYLFIVVPITIHIMDIDQKRVIDIYRLSISIHSGYIISTSG
jgi:hypothetical protein